MAAPISPNKHTDQNQPIVHHLLNLSAWYSQGPPCLLWVYVSISDLLLLCDGTCTVDIEQRTIQQCPLVALPIKAATRLLQCSQIYLMWCMDRITKQDFPPASTKLSLNPRMFKMASYWPPLFLGRHYGTMARGWNPYIRSICRRERLDWAAHMPLL